MKKLALVLMFALVATSALAQNWGEDNVGVYFDAAATSIYVDGIVPGNLQHCYLIGTNLSSPLVSGFELKLSLAGPGAILGTSIAYPTDAANLASRPDEYVVGFAGPVPVVGGDFILMEYDVVVTGAGSVCSYIDPIYFASIPGEFAYLGVDPSDLRPMFRSTGNPVNPSESTPVCSINGLCDGAVPTQDAAWGSVKSLYR